MSLGESALSDVFDRKRNGLNAIRFALAAGVVFWHAYPLSDRTLDWAPAHQFMENLWVDGFFAISGFLIVGSWMNNPSPRRYLTARLLRILPGFYVCLLVTAGLIAPLGAILSGGTMFSMSSLTYIFKNAALWVFQFDIAGTITTAPFPRVWNGSLWTLAWEFLCYIGVLILGLTGLLKRTAALVLAFALLWGALFASTVGMIGGTTFHDASRFGLAFVSGALVWKLAHKLPVSPAIVAAAFVVTAAAMFLPDYRLVAMPFLAYGLIGMGALIKHERAQFRNDLSYGLYIYAFPVQQLLALSGLAALPVAIFGALSLLCTLPLAALSWFLVEKPAQRFKQKARPSLVEQCA